MSNLHMRRRFLQLLAASPILASLDRSFWLHAAQGDADLIAKASDALDVFDFEPVARRNIPPAHFGYLSTGTDDDATIEANRQGFSRYQLRVRRLVDASRVDMSTSLFGTTYDTPLLLCPVGSQKTFHPDGEIAVARAAKKYLQVLATPTSTSIEDVTAATGGPVWFQLYQRREWEGTRQLIRRAEAAGSPALVFTVDMLGGSNRETVRRAARRDTRACLTCHPGGDASRDTGHQPMLAGLPPSTGSPVVAPPTWEYVKRLKDATPMRLLLKGIVTGEDAALALEHGADGVWVSNHGGRAENSLRSTIECVLEVASAVGGRAPIIVDSGFRRGTDMFKALALGATAVGIGRPFLWGLGAFGQEGVEAVLAILRRELQIVMRQAGTRTVSAISPAYLVDRGRT